MNEIELLRILDAIDPKDIDLPAPPEHLCALLEKAETAVVELEVLLGKAAKSEYYRCSRSRFVWLLNLALSYIPKGGTIIDIGNAPGYLGILMHEAGYTVHGVNLSDDWNKTYPDPVWRRRLNVSTHDIEKERLPFDDNSFDGIVFTEVLEHIAITSPATLLRDFSRVLKPSGCVVFSTPNVCNLSNIVALAKGLNVFWRPDIFYGGLDRHNREWTPIEVKTLFRDNGFSSEAFFGISDHSNWREGTAQLIYPFLEKNPSTHPALLNTICSVFRIKADMF